MPQKHKKPLKAIREMCIECMGGRDNPGYNKLIADCASKDCPLYDFRLGNNPHHKKNLTDEQRNRKREMIRVSILSNKIPEKVE